MNGGFFAGVTAFVAVILLALTVPNFGTVLRAARADGAWGTFTASRLACVQHPGHEACSWYGAFTSRTGSREVALYGSERDTLAQGSSVRAVDVGRTSVVYTAGGSNEWILTSLLLVTGLALLVPVGRQSWRRSRSRWAAYRSVTEGRTP